MDFNLAPLSVRRDMSMLGVIHRATLVMGLPQLWPFFRFDISRSIVGRRRRHERQVVEWPRDRDLDIMRRSALRMIRVYNILPAESVAKKDLKTF